MALGGGVNAGGKVGAVGLGVIGSVGVTVGSIWVALG
jgi:hypothetical protein